MRKVEVGDKIVVTKIDNKEIAPELVEVFNVNSDNRLAEVFPSVDSAIGGSLIRLPSGRSDAVSGEVDDWRFAVRKGDRLIVSRINGKEIYPTEVIADENEWDENGGLIFIDRFVSSDDRTSDVLDVIGVYDDDEWRFAEESPHTEKDTAKEVCGDICDSYNDVVAKDDVEAEYVPQSFSDFNASSGGGKTLKDYTGVGFTKEELAFKSSHDKAIESLTADSLAFSPIEEDTSDIVNHPSHYNYGDIEVIDMLEALSSGYSDSTDAYLISTAAKYLYRADHKGKKVEDWKKAVWYIERAIEREEAHNE